MKEIVIGKWFPKSTDIDYGDEDTNEARKRNPNLTLAPNVAEVLALRRTKFKLSPAGEYRFNQIKRELSLELDLPINEIYVRYDQHCGCSCSCSPGFKVKTKANLDINQMRKAQQYFSEFSARHYEVDCKLTPLSTRHVKEYTSQPYVRVYY